MVIELGSPYPSATGQALAAIAQGRLAAAQIQNQAAQRVGGDPAALANALLGMAQQRTSYDYALKSAQAKQAFDLYKLGRKEQFDLFKQQRGAELDLQRQQANLDAQRRMQLETQQAIQQRQLAREAMKLQQKRLESVLPQLGMTFDQYVRYSRLAGIDPSDVDAGIQFFSENEPYQPPKIQQEIQKLNNEIAALREEAPRYAAVGLADAQGLSEQLDALTQKRNRLMASGWAFRPRQEKPFAQRVAERITPLDAMGLPGAIAYDDGSGTIKIVQQRNVGKGSADEKIAEALDRVANIPDPAARLQAARDEIRRSLPYTSILSIAKASQLSLQDAALLGSDPAKEKAIEQQRMQQLLDSLIRARRPEWFQEQGGGTVGREAQPAAAEPSAPPEPPPLPWPSDGQFEPNKVYERFGHKFKAVEKDGKIVLIRVD